MINLLPVETKTQLRAAHTNVLLFKYLLVLGSGVTFLALAFGASYIFLTNNKTAIKKLEDNSQSTVSLYSVAQKQLNSILSSVTVAKNIMDQQISYSDIVTGIAAALPTGIVIDKIVVDNSTIGKPITLLARAKTADSVPLMKDNFTQSALFSNYNLLSVTTNAGDSSGLPVQISISITINKGTAL